MAGLDGIKKKIDPGEPHDMDLFELSKEEAEGHQDRAGQPGEGPGELSRRTTTSCCAGDVFTKDLVETWIDYKRNKENDAIRLRPHPYEYFLYYDCLRGEGPANKPLIITLFSQMEHDVAMGPVPLTMKMSHIIYGLISIDIWTMVYQS